MGWNPKKQLKRWTVGSAFGHKTASPLNPFTHGYWTARKVIRGLKRGTWKGNLAKYYGGVKRTSPGVSSAAGFYNSNAVYGPTGSIVGRY